MSRAERRAAAERRRADYAWSILDAVGARVGHDKRLISLRECLEWAAEAASALYRSRPQDRTVIVQAADLAMADIIGIWKRTHAWQSEPALVAPLQPSAFSLQPSPPNPEPEDAHA